MFQQATLPEVEVYEVLSNARRRKALTELWAQPDTLSLRELSERIAATESGQTPAPRALRESVYNALHQVHLPKLDALGLVVYDPDRKTVRVCSRASHLSRYMDVTTRAGVTWGEYYRGLGIVGLFATVGSLASVPVLSAVDPLVPATVFLLVFAISTLYQLGVGRLRLRGRITRLYRRLF
ncbi:hypothetical protein EKH57_15760 [Halorubrum sp. BOL3-1]|uniref:DUF7344 domain-containing protein n=1 Tax=Halorubrum sp. BOL3-1 TaxID=2497325 RepID=UPI001004E5E0|nr:hypothetical protein [Halorubrum sp. BOL3-1]QAU14041.1 hypothetical protein EKH57_15760 [Halorubrum sp. BOL3-1]